MVTLFKIGNSVNTPIKLYGVDNFTDLPPDAAAHSIALIASDENNGGQPTIRIKTSVGEWIVANELEELLKI